MDMLKSLLGVVLVLGLCSIAFLGRDWDSDQASRARVGVLEVIYRPASARPADAQPPESVEAATAPTVQDQTLVVDAEALNLRAGPSTTTEVLRALPQGTVVAEAARTGNWVQVRTADGEVGWMSARYLRGSTLDLPAI